MKFHPDKNQGDPFFTQRFIEIKEAYKVLADPSKRKDYDYNTDFYSAYRSSVKSWPVIDYFAIDKSIVLAGDEFTFSWQTHNADTIILEPFGPVAANGYKTYRIKVSRHPVITFRLIAKNTETGQQAQAVLNVKYGGEQRRNPAVSLLIMIFVFIFLYMIAQLISCHHPILPG